MALSHRLLVSLAAIVVSACGGSSGGGGLGGGGSGSANGPSGGPTASNGTNAGSGGAGTASNGAGLAPNVGSGGEGALITYGEPFDGGEFHEGPVRYDEVPWHNACASGDKYLPAVQQAEGNLLAGLWNGIPNVAGFCDACIWVTTKMGKSALLRVVTYGETTENSIDVSPEAYAILNSGEYPRLMSWQFARCSETGPMMYEFQTGAHEFWTSLWVRNARVPLSKVEVKSANHGDFVELERGGDGTLTDNSGFGVGTFSIRSTGVDGQAVTHSFEWPSKIGGALLNGTGNFE